MVSCSSTDVTGAAHIRGSCGEDGEKGDLFARHGNRQYRWARNLSKLIANISVVMKQSIQVSLVVRGAFAMFFDIMNIGARMITVRSLYNVIDTHNKTAFMLVLECMVMRMLIL